MKKSYLLLIGLITIFSCSSKKDIEENQDSKRSRKDYQISELQKKYNSEYLLDSVQLKYSIEFEGLLSSEVQLLRDFKVTDIFKRDSSQYIFLESGYIPTFYLELEVDKNALVKLLSLEKRYYENSDAVLAIKLTSIRKINLKLEEFPEDESILSRGFEDPRAFFGTGRVLEVAILKK